LLSLITMVLGSVTIVFWLLAPVLMPIFSPGFSPHLQHLTVQLSRVMFPIVLLLALSGVVVGMLNSFEHFSVPALAPVVWNLIIIGSLVGLTPLFHGDDDVYAYAIGVLTGTIVQFLLPLPWLRGRGGRFTFNRDWRNAARADLDSLRRTMSNGIRQILMLLIPSAVIMGVLAVPITRLVYQRGAFGTGATHLVSQAMWVWALSLPANGASLLFSRTFFSLQRPWLNTSLAMGNLAVNVAVSAALYSPLGVKGVV